MILLWGPNYLTRFPSLWRMLRSISCPTALTGLNRTGKTGPRILMCLTHSTEKQSLLMHLVLLVVKDAESLVCDKLDQAGMTEELVS